MKVAIETRSSSEALNTYEGTYETVKESVEAEYGKFDWFEPPEKGETVIGYDSKTVGTYYAVLQSQ